MCNCILWVRRRLLALLLIIGCMAVSATASATVCFLPDAEDCGLSSASDGNSVCDGSTTYASVTDCNNSITLNNNSQYCEKDGACYRRYCKYPTQSDCEAGVKDYTHKYDHFFCVYDSSTSCYDLQNTPCIEKTTKTGCDGYKLDAPTEGKTCGSCSQRVVTETCSAEGLPGETDEYKTVYDCVEPKYQQIGCDSFDKTETEKNTLEAAPNNYHCTSCTKTNQKQDYEGHWNDYGKGDTMYKCKPTCATYGLVTSCSQGSGEAGTIAFVEDTKGRTNYDGKKCGTCGCTPKPCTGFDYTEDTLSDKTNAISCDLGCDKGKKWKCNTEYKYDSSTKSCKKIELQKTTITIAFSDVNYDNIALLGDNSEYGNYYKTIKFTSKSSDNSSHTVELRTYPSVTCITKNTTSSPVIVQENTETVYVSECGSKTKPLQVMHTASIETYIDDKLVATHQILVANLNWFTSTLDGKSVISGNYIIKYRAAKCADWGYLNAQDKCSGKKRQKVGLSGSDGACYSCEQSGSGSSSDSTCKPGTATIEYARYYYYKPTTPANAAFVAISYNGSFGSPTVYPSVSYTNMSTKFKFKVEDFIQKTTLNVKQDLAGKEDDSITYTYSMSFGDGAVGGDGDFGLVPPKDPAPGIENGSTGGRVNNTIVGTTNTSSTKWSCGSKLMTKADYTKATGRKEGGRLDSKNAAGNSMYYDDNTFNKVRLFNDISCAGEYVLVYGCKK